MNPYGHTEDCPDCGEPLDMPSSEGAVVCPECGERWGVTFDADGLPDGGYRAEYHLKREERCRHHPSAWRSCWMCRSAESGV